MYYKSLGVSANFIGILGAITPAITFIASPLWGLLAGNLIYNLLPTMKYKFIRLFFLCYICLNLYFFSFPFKKFLSKRREKCT